MVDPKAFETGIPDGPEKSKIELSYLAYSGRADDGDALWATHCLAG
jgi:hypothetical protein